MFAINPPPISPGFPLQMQNKDHLPPYSMADKYNFPRRKTLAALHASLHIDLTSQYLLP